MPTKGRTGGPGLGSVSSAASPDLVRARAVCAPQTFHFPWASGSRRSRRPVHGVVTTPGCSSLAPTAARSSAAGPAGWCRSIAACTRSGTPCWGRRVAGWRQRWPAACTPCWPARSCGVVGLGGPCRAGRSMSPRAAAAARHRGASSCHFHATAERTVVPRDSGDHADAHADRPGHHGQRPDPGARDRGGRTGGGCSAWIQLKPNSPGLPGAQSAVRAAAHLHAQRLRSHVRRPLRPPRHFRVHSPTTSSASAADASGRTAG